MALILILTTRSVIIDKMEWHVQHSASSVTKHLTHIVIPGGSVSESSTVDTSSTLTREK